MGGRRVTLGEVAGAFGVQGWIRVHSYCRPAEGILQYPRWQVAGQARELAEGRRQGAAVVARLRGVEGRDAALALRGAAIEVERAELPPAAPGEYYWADLVGCEVRTTRDAVLGRVGSLFSTGAQDVMAVRGAREHLIPFVAGPIVKDVDLAAGRIVVEWDAEA